MNRYNNSKSRAALRKQLITERGKVCQNCKCTQSKNGVNFAEINETDLAKYLVLHEIDNNKKNLEPANCLILCKSCNNVIEAKRPLNRFEKRLEALNNIRVESRKYKANEILRYGSEGMRRNVEGQRAVRDWLDLQLEEKTIIEVSWFIPNASSIGGVTINTIETSWLITMTSESDDYELIRGKTYIKRREKVDHLKAKYDA